MNRRDFTKFFIVAAAFFLPSHSLVGAVKHKYRLASETILPEGLRAAPDEIREAYRFAVANRDILRYIPCYCGCGEQGHTSNASCYVKDSSPLDKPEFDSMSIGWKICIGITRDVMRMMDEGKRLKDIRAYIEKTYSQYGPSTPTPSVPGKVNEFWINKWGNYENGYYNRGPVLLLGLCGWNLNSKDLAAKYDQFARQYDCFEGLLGLLGVSKLRQAVFSEASGKVLEVAIGTGRNLQYYRNDCEVIAVDVSGEMLKVARERGAKLNVKVQFALADAEALPFRDRCFDTVVSSLSTCTFPNPVNALQEMARVSKPSSQILLLEHGRSDRQWFGRWQDRHADKFAKPFGCHWNRDPLELAKRAGLKIIRVRRNFFGVFHRIAAVLGTLPS